MQDGLPRMLTEEHKSWYALTSMGRYHQEGQVVTEYEIRRSHIIPESKYEFLELTTHKEVKLSL
jgi:hypothetical protein